MDLHNSAHRNGFLEGLTPITSYRDNENNTGISFSILKLRPGQTYEIKTENEMAFLLMEGSVEWEIKEQTIRSQRGSLFDESPFAIHAPVNQRVCIIAHSNIEVALFETPNTKPFPLIVYHQNATHNEHRGKGCVGDTSLRFVRTIFDGSTSHPNTELVLGEVVNFPGRWSSYPPHHHPQPEIYHYRFTKPNGYGHAELGEDVIKIKQFDTVKILNGLDHAQCSAPGYGMYYIWVIRHLPNNRYTVPEFTEEHKWTMDSSAIVWEPQEEEALV